MAKRTIKDFRRPADDGENTGSQRVEKRRPRRKNWIRVLLRLLIVVLIALALYLLAVNWKEIAPESIVSWMDDLFGGTVSGSWPVSINGDSVAAMDEAGSNLVILTDTASVYYNSSGGESVRRTHAYAKPVLRTNGKYVLLAETGGSRFRLETRSSVLFEQTISNVIYTAAVSKGGDVAVVTDSSQSHISEVTVFSAKGVQRYQWLSAEWLVIDAAFSSDGNSLAVVGCRSSGGAMESTVMVFSLRSSEEQPVQYTANDVLYSRVSFFDNGTVAAVGESALRIVNPTGSLDQTISYENAELIGYAFNNGVALVTRPYGSQENGTLKVFSTTGDMQLEQPFEGVFRDISPCGDSYLLLTEHRIYHVGNKDFDRFGETAADSLMTAAIGDDALVLGLTALSVVTWQTD